jgi:hypothetical protein
VAIVTPFTVSDFIQNGLEFMTPEKFFVYDPFNNNCQVFVRSVMTANTNKGLVNYTADEDAFIFQNVSTLVNGLSRPTKFIARRITDLAHKANILLHGRGFASEDAQNCKDYVCRGGALTTGGTRVLQHSIAHMRPWNHRMQAQLKAIRDAASPAQASHAIDMVNSDGIQNNHGQVYTLQELLNGMAITGKDGQHRPVLVDYKRMVPGKSGLSQMEGAGFFSLDEDELKQLADHTGHSSLEPYWDTVA